MVRHTFCELMMKRSKKYYRFAIPTLISLACVFLVLGYMNLKLSRIPEGMITLAASIMIMVQAVGVLVCKKIDEAVETMNSQNIRVDHIPGS